MNLAKSYFQQFAALDLISFFFMNEEQTEFLQCLKKFTMNVLFCN